MIHYPIFKVRPDNWQPLQPSPQQWQGSGVGCSNWSPVHTQQAHSMAQNQNSVVVPGRIAISLASHISDSAIPQLEDTYGTLQDLVIGRGSADLLIQHLESAELKERDRLIEWIISCASALSLSSLGSRVIQKALDVSTGVSRHKLFEHLIPHVYALVRSLHGNFVLQKLIVLMNQVEVDAVVHAMSSDVLNIAKHNCGCRVIERLLEHFPDIPSMKPLVEQLMFATADLARHRNGNFVIGAMLEHAPSHVGRQVSNRLLPEATTLAMHRGSSHVLQKAIQHGCWETRGLFAQCFLTSQMPRVEEITTNKFGALVLEELLRHDLGVDGKQLQERMGIA